MSQKRFNAQQALRFKRFSHRSYALFSCVGKEVLICTLSVATLSHAKAEGMSTRPALASDSLGRREVKLDEVVVTSSRAPLTALQSAKVVSVITRDDIYRAEAQSLNDILKLTTGVDVRQRGGFGVQTDISINGGTFDQITILLNGINISSPQTGHNAADFPFSLSDIERIEVLEGASARVCGSSAFCGAINIVTRSDAKSNIRVQAEGGSFGTFGGDASVNVSMGAFASKLSGGYTQSDGGTTNSDFRRRRLYWQGHCSSRYADVQWQMGLSAQDFGANTFYSAKYDNQFEATRRLITSVSADLRPLATEQLVVTPSAYWHRDRDHYQLIRGMEGANNGENWHRTDVYGGGINIHGSWFLGKTAAGVDIRKEHIVSTAYGDALPENEWKDIKGSSRKYDHSGSRTNTSLFLEHNIIIGGFTLSAGVLANRNTGIDNKFRLYPGIDLSFRPNDSWKFYASWNKALRVPTFTDLYTNNAVQTGDISLRPEKNSTVKIGVRYRRTGVEATVTGFYSHGTDIIDWVYSTPDARKYHAMNIGRLDNMGYSIECVGNLQELFPSSFVTRIKLGYAFIHQRHETDRDIYGSLYALEYLRHKVTLQLDHRIWSRLSASWAVRWQERMNNYTPYTKVDVKLQWTAPRYTLYVKADNITCHRYYDLGNVLQPGLWVMAGGSITIGL